MVKTLLHSGYRLILRVQLNEMFVVKPKEEYHKLFMSVEPTEPPANTVRPTRFILLEGADVTDDNLEEALNKAIEAGKKYIDAKQSISNMQSAQLLHSLGFEYENGR